MLKSLKIHWFTHFDWSLWNRNLQGGRGIWPIIRYIILNCTKIITLNHCPSYIRLIKVHVHHTMIIILIHCMYSQVFHIPSYCDRSRGCPISITSILKHYKWSVTSWNWLISCACVAANLRAFPSIKWVICDRQECETNHV